MQFLQLVKLRKTIEILNTDAEGRLVLADALTYTERKFKQKFIVDLATLTGAIIVSLGSEYAGLFSNDDKLSNQLYEAGIKVEEKVWRMPLNKNYDKLINSKLDAGKVILQKRVRVYKNDNSKTLAKRILKQEHKIYPLALNKLISNS